MLRTQSVTKYRFKLIISYLVQHCQQHSKCLQTMHLAWICSSGTMLWWTSMPVQNTAVFSILLVVGVVGNASVVFIYKLKMTKTMEERLLAMSDLLACVSLCVFATQQSLAPVIISNTALCISFFYLQYASSAALQRYRMVCDPVWRRMSKKLKYTVIATAILFSYTIYVEIFAVY